MPKTIWCLGMYASASTWLFNVALKIARALYPDRPVVGGFVHTLANLEIARGHAGLAIVKSHETELAAADGLGRLADCIFVSIRDPRDVVASLMTSQGHGFDKALRLTEASARLCSRFARDPRTALLRYESGFVDDPGTLVLLAARLDGTLAPQEQARIFDETRRAAIEQYIAGIEKMPTTLWSRQTGDYLDPATHWHRHHANRTGEIGRWRHVLSPGKTAIIEANLADWTAEFGYASSPPATTCAPRDSETAS
jgi:hypothetical protein